ncbi:type II secretion system F family protein [Candidatus Pacearchaeota archaeon]|nr:type II secretion system F family protein [Candidatus Pacearchaeota archaeon]
MALENLKNNIKIEKDIINGIININSEMQRLGEGQERQLIEQKLKSSVGQLKMVNSSIPQILDSISPVQGLKEKEEKVEKLVNINYQNIENGELISATIKKEDENRFVEELRLSKRTLEKLKRGKLHKVEGKYGVYRKAGLYAKISNMLFFNISNHFVKEGKFKRLNSAIRKANLNSLVSTYISMTLFSALLAFILGIIIFVFFLFFSVSFSSPFISPAGEITFLMIIRNLAIMIFLPIITALLLYMYPQAEVSGIEGKINQEIPFVAIHMSAIAESGIEPTQIFKIIALSEEYPYTANEVKKIINQINLYGYDLLTALRNTSRETSSKKLAELLNGIATTISGGSDLASFFEKRAETLLFDYKMEREKYTKAAETFMDIYIGVVIAAPMIITLLLVLMAVTGISAMGLTIDALTIVILLIVGLINILFLVFLQLYQPTY